MNAPFRITPRSLLRPAERILWRALAGPFVMILFVVILFVAPYSISYGQSDTESSLTPEQSEEVLRLFRRYMMEHPEDVVGALDAYAKKEEKTKNEKVHRTLAVGRAEIENDEGSFVGGNPDGNVSVIEFFDYRCSYCKKVHNTVRKLIEKDGNLRMVYKEFPILGPNSVVASRAALASRRQNKYLPYHNALMSARGSLDRKRIFEIAGDVGLDVDQLGKDMEDPAIAEIISRNHALAQRLNIGGTPAFVIGDEIVAGAAEYGRFRSMVNLARQSCTTC